VAGLAAAATLVRGRRLKNASTVIVYQYQGALWRAGGYMPQGLTGGTI